MFHVGQKVVFIGEEWGEATKRAIAKWAAHGVHLPEKRQIYTVRDCGPVFAPQSTNYPYKDTPHIRLDELVNPPAAGLPEVNWPVAHFRPVREHSIQIFRDIANGVKQKENA